MALTDHPTTNKEEMRIDLNIFGQNMFKFQFPGSQKINTVSFTKLSEYVCDLTRVPVPNANNVGQRIEVIMREDGKYRKYCNFYKHVDYYFSPSEMGIGNFLFSHSIVEAPIFVECTTNPLKVQKGRREYVACLTPKGNWQ